MIVDWQVAKFSSMFPNTISRHLVPHSETYPFFYVTGRGQLKRNGTSTETRFCLSAKRTSTFKSAGRQFSRLVAAEVCASAVVMLNTPCSEVEWRVLATHSIRQFPFHFPSRASPCAITFHLESNRITLSLRHSRWCHLTELILVKRIFCWCQL